MRVGCEQECACVWCEQECACVWDVLEALAQGHVRGRSLAPWVPLAPPWLSVGRGVGAARPWGS